jgi:hypothetical protein
MAFLELGPLPFQTTTDCIWDRMISNCARRMCGRKTGFYLHHDASSEVMVNAEGNYPSHRTRRHGNNWNCSKSRHFGARHRHCVEKIEGKRLQTPSEGFCDKFTEPTGRSSRDEGTILFSNKKFSCVHNIRLTDL